MSSIGVGGSLFKKMPTSPDQVLAQLSPKAPMPGALHYICGT